MNVEEWAFKDRKELANLNEIDLLTIIEFLQSDRRNWITQFSNTHNESIDLQEQIKTLNDQLDRELIKRARLEDKIKKITKIIDSYNLGKYDYSIPQTGIIELKEILEVRNEKK